MKDMKDLKVKKMKLFQWCGQAFFIVESAESGGQAMEQRFWVLSFGLDGSWVTAPNGGQEIFLNCLGVGPQQPFNIISERSINRLF
jgi:hypothetical protein